MSYFFIYLGIAILISYLFSPFFIYIAKKYEILATPKENVFLHHKGKPYLGGLSIYLSFIITLLFFFIWKIGDPEIIITLEKKKLFCLLLGGALIALIDLVRDIYSIKINFVKFLSVIMASILMIFADVRTHLWFLEIGKVSIGQYNFYIGNAILTLAWVLLLVYLFDNIEKIDTLVTGIATIISLFLFAFSIFSHDYTNAFLSIMFVGALLGILWNQLKPSEFLLGKMGSCFIGYVLSFLTLSIDFSQKSSMGFIIPILIMAMPLVFFLLPFLRNLKDFSKKLSFEETIIIFEKMNKQENKLVFFILNAVSIIGFLCFLIYFIQSTILIIMVISMTLLILSIFLINFYRYEIE